MQVEDKVWDEMGPMPSLKHLHLGSLNRLDWTRQRMESLWNPRESHPKELSLWNAYLTEDSLSALAQYSNLKALGITGSNAVKIHN